MSELAAGWQRRPDSLVGHYFGRGAYRSACGHSVTMGQPMQPYPPRKPCDSCVSTIAKIDDSTQALNDQCGGDWFYDWARGTYADNLTTRTCKVFDKPA